MSRRRIRITKKRKKSMGMKGMKESQRRKMMKEASFIRQSMAWQHWSP